MAFTYLSLNIVFIALVLWGLKRSLHTLDKAFWITLLALLVLTALFDNFMIWAQVIGYNNAKLLGWFVGLAPIEDFFYAVLAAIMVPVIWNRLGQKSKEKEDA